VLASEAMKPRRGAPIAAIILLLGWGAVARAGVAPAKDDGTSDADDPAGDQTAAATGATPPATPTTTRA